MSRRPCENTERVISCNMSNPPWCALCSEYTIYFLSLRISDGKSIHSPRHHHSSFPSAPSPNCKHSLTSCPRLRSLTPVSCGSSSPTDVSAPQSPLGCFLAEWRRSLRVSLGDRAGPDPGHLLEEGLARRHSTGKTHVAVGHLLSKLVSCLHVNRAEQRHKWGCQESKYTFH